MSRRARGAAIRVVHHTQVYTTLAQALGVAVSADDVGNRTAVWAKRFYRKYTHVPANSCDAYTIIAARADDACDVRAVIITMLVIKDCIIVMNEVPPAYVVN